MVTFADFRFLSSTFIVIDLYCATDKITGYRRGGDLVSECSSGKYELPVLIHQFGIHKNQTLLSGLHLPQRSFRIFHLVTEGQRHIFALDNIFVRVLGTSFEIVQKDEPLILLFFTFSLINDGRGRCFGDNEKL